MTFFKKTIPAKNIPLWESIFVISGICLFALTIHKDSYIQYVSLICLIFTGVIITRSAQDFSSLLWVIGIIPFNKKVISKLIAGVLFGCVLGVLNNFFFEESLLPSSLTKFAITAPLIGIVEELVFRGYVQTKTSSMGALFSIIFASLGHTLYKYLVIKTLPVDLNIIAFLLYRSVPFKAYLDFPLGFVASVKFFLTFFFFIITPC